MFTTMSEGQTTPLIQPVTPHSHSVFLPSSPYFTSFHYFCHPGRAITDELLKKCATLFSENYSVLGQNPTITNGPKQGLSSLLTF